MPLIREGGKYEKLPFTLVVRVSTRSGAFAQSVIGSGPDEPVAKIAAAA